MTNGRVKVKKEVKSIVSSDESDELPPYDEIRENLLNWYTENHRKLPWRVLQKTVSKGKNSKEGCLNESKGRKSRKRKEIVKIESENEENMDSAGTNDSDEQLFAYKIWISEIMAQQTQIKTVIPYFKRWMERFPTLQDLASSSLEDVNQVWSGLGYYRRAKYLQNGAKYVMDSLNGRIPSKVEELMKIPGIGQYTGGAISSIAFPILPYPISAIFICVLFKCKLK